MTEIISVVIPVYNRAPILGRALTSIRQQTRPVDEIVVVDDGSSDDLEAALRPFADLPIRLIRQANAGAAAARNAGVATARGDILAFLDSDDAWLPEKTARQAAYLAQAPGDVLAVTTGFVMTGSDKAPGEVPWDQLRIPRSRRCVEDQLWICDVSPGSTLMLRRSAWEKVGPLDTTLRRLEDWDWLIRLGHCGKLEVLPEVLAVIYRSPPPSPLAIHQACRALWGRNAERLDRLGRQRLRAAIHLEEFAVARGAGHHLAALAALTKAAIGWPSRVGSFLFDRLF
jgi:glycosyltransferase involved in cell wall biosynthesis